MACDGLSGTGLLNLPKCRHRGSCVEGRGIACFSGLVGKRFVELVDCWSCEFEDHEPDEHPLACVHRGAELRVQRGDLCGCRDAAMRVFACSIHGECTLHKQAGHIRSCAACEDRERAVV